MKFNKFNFALFAALSVATFSCDETEEVLSQTELDEIARQEMLEAAEENFDLITESKWKPFKFEPSEDMVTSSQTEDGLIALTTITRAGAIGAFDMTISFTEEGDAYKAAVEVPAEGDELTTQLLAYQDVIMPGMAGMGFLVFSEAEYLAEIKGAVLSAFAADGLTNKDIADSETGLETLSIEENELESLTFGELLLNSKKLIKENSDKVYFNEEGQLVIEFTYEGLGTSKWIYTKAN